jgi:valyl-tRNA synthetase
MKLDKSYNPKDVEDKIYRLWLKSGFFNPDKLPKGNKKPYTIVIPPPNVTGSLHMGHALNATIQDILIRWKRMNGFKTLWLPGTDHAGIATQNVVEKELRKQGKTRFDLGQEEFIKEIWKWKQEYGDIILSQLKKIGCSCDWSRTRFTMDDDYGKAVKQAFLHYYKKGLIYQAERVINWCPRCATSLSDLELEYKEEKGKLWYIKYGPITVATTRPETMLGDTAVAVNPKDKRYKDLIGKKVILPLVNREIPIVADRLVDPKFGTGAVKVTPAHDLIDYQVAQNHKLEMVQVINEKARITNKAPKKYQGLKILEAREEIIKDLKAQNLLEKQEDYLHQIPKCYRCNTIIELIPSLQWFLRMEELAKKALKPVKQGKIKFHPKNFEKPYFDWLKNIKDWCISRQILGWPEKTKDLKTFYPTDVLSTARDIINLWVARMIFSSLEFRKEIPFQDVYIHATILTKDGKRMSKSLGTGVDPLELIDQYGADATRFGLAYQVMGNQDMKFSNDNIVMGKKFCNKIWNATRFVLLKTSSSIKEAKLVKATSADKKILSQLDKTKKSVNSDLEKFKFGKAAHTLYDFFWHDFCDKYLEESKKQDDENTQRILIHVLLNSLRLLHPFIPFITEEIYQQLPIKDKKKSLMIEAWPK